MFETTIALWIDWTAARSAEAYMDGEGFDRIARSLGQRVGRRGAIGGAAAGLATLAGIAGRDDAAAKKKGKKTCKPPKAKCGKKCVNADSDRKHCGDCKTKCAKDEDCAAGACVGKCGKGKPKYTQDFEKNTSGWHGTIERVKSGTNDVDAYSGNFFAKVPGDPDIHTDTGVFTRWGEYSGVFPKHGYTTEVAIYLDPANAPTTAAQFDYSSAIDGTDCNHRRDFIFTVGVDTEAATPWFCI
ncbi:MAG TPA: hypothetical protein VFI22_06465, partial [Thermomicrobiales bacterium]|nr:hypothetical protein [Thermomicrobiales bacterium]